VLVHRPSNQVSRIVILATRQGALKLSDRDASPCRPGFQADCYGNYEAWILRPALTAERAGVY
jgi:hypothetical protein